MIPKLFDEFVNSDTSYGTSYLGTLTTCTRCDVNEVRNGSYTLELETTVNDICANMIRSQRIIQVKPNPFDDPQYFEIESTERTLDGKIKVSAKHIKSLCFGISTNPVGSKDPENPDVFTNVLPKQAWEYIQASYMGTPREIIPFNFYSNVEGEKDFSLGLTTPETLGDILGGKEGSFLDTWGGEFWWDNFNIYLKAARGSTKYYKIRYGQNISDANQSESCESTYSYVLPYGSVNNTSNHKLNISAPAVAIPNSTAVYKKTKMVDCTEALDGYTYGPQTAGGSTLLELQAVMQNYALHYATSNQLGDLNVNISVTLRAELDEMSQIGLCDTVTVILDNFGTQATAKITEVTYDALMERWDKIVIGSAKVTVSDLILNKNRYV